MLMMKDLEGHQAALIDLVNFAKDHGELVVNEETPKFLSLFTEATKRELNRAELDRLNQLIREFVILPIYSAPFAAAWLGMTYEGIVYARQKGLLAGFKQGHDWLFPHSEVVRYAGEKRYGGGS